jgi:hypothetical protein
MMINERMKKWLKELHDWLPWNRPRPPPTNSPNSASQLIRRPQGGDETVTSAELSCSAPIPVLALRSEPKPLIQSELQVVEVLFP